MINTVLTLRDNMSGGLIKAAREAQKSSKLISNDMLKATRQVVAFKNKSVSAMRDFAKKSAVAASAAVAGLATGLIALDGATEEYRIAQGKLKTAFQAANLSADDAKVTYAEFYKILGDTDTATEASQLLAKLTQNSEDLTKWTRIAAGVHGTFGDSLPIEHLMEAANETAKVGKVVNVLADALNWAGISEDKFNETLEAAGNESARNQIILDTLAKTYDSAADAFYKNNAQLIKSRNYQTQLSNTMAVLGNASQTAKSGILELLGAQESGGFRKGSVFAILTEQAERFSAWVQSADFSSFAAKVDVGFSTAVEKAAGALEWCKDNGDTLIGGLKFLAGAFAGVKIVQFTSGVVGAVRTIGGFLSTIGVMTAATTAQSAATGTATLAQHGLNAAMKANPIGFVISLIAALVAVGVALYQNWDTVKATAIALWEAVKEKFQGIKDVVVGAFDAAIEWGGKVKDFFVDTFLGAINKIKGAFDKVKDAVSGLINKVKDFLGMDTTKTVKVKTEYDSGGYGHNALGTSYWRGGPTAVHERGGEIIDLPGGTRIIPHDVSEKMAAGRNVNVYVTVQGNVIGNRQYADELGEIVVGKVLRAIDNV